MHLQDGTISLFLACQEGHVTTTELLIEAGASLDVQRNVSCNLDTANSPQLLVAVSILSVGGDACTHSQVCTNNTTWAVADLGIEKGGFQMQMRAKRARKF